MRDHYEAIRQAGGAALLVTQARPEFLARLLEDQPLPFPAVTDPSRAAYRAFGLTRTSVAAMLHPRVVVRFFRLLFRGWRFQLPYQGEDVLQLGGDFVIDGEGRLAYAYRSAEPTDRPAVADLLKAIRSAGDPT